MTYYRRRETGATALIIVMFFTLLLTVLSVGFVQLMVQEQKASQDSELSQGAYDSALAGAEDGKRVLKACLDGDANACAIIDNGNCNTVTAAGILPDDKGIIQSNVSASSSSNGSDYSQAYTCVIINRDTKDVVGTLSADISTIEPLRTKPGDSFNQIVVSWFKRANSTSDTVTLDAAGDTSLDFTPVAAWPKSRPPVLRVQLMQYADKGGFNLTDFDATGGGSTLYLYPKSTGVALSFANDSRRSGTLVPYATKCASTFTANSGYACQTTITLPNPVGGTAANRVAYVRLTSIYNDADFSLQLLNGATPVNFSGVQPSIDATGKAADVYRRVVQRVESTDAAALKSLYPRATVDTSGSFCKDMSMTTDPTNFRDGCTSPTIVY